ncbi:chlorophyllase-1-like [Aristolochia californica]|uniref:chlorophyllase-1-like n=1 Tax=Aristolochia californica TaxID=171875 RepID=UPI0035E1FC0E
MDQNVFDWGKHKPVPCTPSDPPSPLKIFTPDEGGEHPVILFVHGFMISSDLYTDLLMRITSHGYIAVAPQLFNSLAFPPIQLETQIDWAAKVADWICGGLQSSLPAGITANSNKLALVGHSRGGKNAFCLFLGHAKTVAKFSALIGIDPVAGKCGIEIAPQILNTNTFGNDVPVLVIGTGLGGERKAKYSIACSCAPKGLNHVEFYKRCSSPCYHIVAEDYGHMDMLDDGEDSLEGRLSYKICKNGKDRATMRKCVGGLVVAFLRFALEKDGKALAAIYSDPGISPTKIVVEKK